MFKNKTTEDTEFHRGNKVHLEKGDLPAMILAGFITFGPIVLVLIGILLLVGWLFGAFSY